MAFQWKVEAIKDEATALSAADQLKFSAGRLREVTREFKAAGKLTKEQERHLKEVDFADTANRLSESEDKLKARLAKSTIPPDASKALSEAFQDFKAAAKECAEAILASAPAQ
jgi:hypothetical protein